jgi:O-antigen/teichoic acid export membrane protein
VKGVAAPLRRNPLPEGTITVGAGLAVAGLAQYGFLAISAHALPPDRYAPLATFWALLFVSGPGFFLPLEQETARAIAARRVRGLGGRPVVARAAFAGLGLSAALVLAVAVASGPVDQRIFNGDPVLLVGLILGLVMFPVQFLARGSLAGNGRFAPYGVLLAGEGIFRMVFAAVLFAAGLKVAGPFGIVMVIASFVAIAIAVTGRRGLLQPGPKASWEEISNALGFLLVASVFTQFLLSIGTVAVQLLAGPTQKAAPGQFLDSRIVAYAPIFLFQAVQAALLPKLSALAAAGRYHEFRKLLAQLLLLVVALGVVAVVGFAALGPFVTQRLFGNAYALGNLDFALLSASCGGFMAAQVLSAALIALSAYRRVAAGWVSGGMAFVLVTLIGSQLFLRVELGLIAGAVAAFAVMAALLLPLLRSRTTSATEPRTLGSTVLPET